VYTLNDRLCGTSVAFSQWLYIASGSINLRILQGKQNVLLLHRMHVHNKQYITLDEFDKYDAMKVDSAISHFLNNSRISLTPFPLTKKINPLKTTHSSNLARTTSHWSEDRCNSTRRRKQLRHRHGTIGLRLWCALNWNLRVGHRIRPVHRPSPGTAVLPWSVRYLSGRGDLGGAGWEWRPRNLGAKAVGVCVIGTGQGRRDGLGWRKEVGQWLIDCALSGVHFLG